MRRFHILPALVVALGLTCLLPQGAAADGTFTVAGVHVDASAASVAEARNAAIAAGRPQAWQILFRRLTPQQDWPRQPVLDPATLQKLMTGYFPVKEKRSTTRYVADVTYIFNPDAVARVLQSSGVPYTIAQAKRVLVIPMAPFYARGSGWTTALASPRFASALVPFAVPSGDAQDANALSKLPFETANWTDIEAVAARIHATEAVLVLASVSGNKMTISLRRLSAGQVTIRSSVEVPLIQGAGSTYSSAADAAVRAIEDMWKSHTAVDYSQRGKLIVEVHTVSLAQFANLQNALAGVPNVAGTVILAMDIDQARLILSYIGTVDQLREALAQAGLILTSRDGAWQLKSGTAP